MLQLFIDWIADSRQPFKFLLKISQIE